MISEPNMPPAEFKRLRDRLGLTTYALAPVLGVSRQQAYRYASGKQRVPEPVARLLYMICGSSTQFDSVTPDEWVIFCDWRKSVD